MEKRLSRFGIGPRIAAAALAYAAVAGAATYFWPDVCILRWLPYQACAAVAVILLAIGVPMWGIALFSVMRAYNRDELVTSGMYGIVRHPMYAGWIVLNIPALTLLSRSWPLMLTPLVAYAVFRRLIRTEDEYLRRRFGASYVEYCSRVNEVIPIPRFWRRA